MIRLAFVSLNCGIFRLKKWTAITSSSARLFDIVAIGTALTLSEDGCGVKEAVAQSLISESRYDGYLRLREDDIWTWKNPARGHVKQ